MFTIGSSITPPIRDITDKPQISVSSIPDTSKRAVVASYLCGIHQAGKFQHQRNPGVEGETQTAR